MTDQLRQAAQALLNRWDSPLWKAGSTADAIADLRTALEQQAEPVQKPKYMAQSNGRHSPLLSHMMNKRIALAEPEQSFEDEQRVINADNHRRANALEEAIHAAWSAGYVEGEKAVLEQQAEPIGWLDGNDKLADFMHRDLKAEHDKRGSITPRDFTIPVYTAPPQRKPLTDEQADKIISGLQTCHHQSSKREFLKVWLRDWAAHGIKEGT